MRRKNARKKEKDERTTKEEEDEGTMSDRGQGRKKKMRAPPAAPPGLHQPGPRKTRGVTRQQVRILKGADATIYQPVGVSLNDLSFDESSEEATAEFLGELNSNNGRTGSWVKQSAVADSGAEEHALPEKDLQFIKMAPSAASKAWKAFRGAGNERIPARGRRVTRGITAEGNQLVTSWEVCPVKRALLSLVKLAKAGNVVRIGAESAHIYNLATRKTTKLRKEGNVFMLDFWVWHDTKVERTPGFTRQVASS